MGPARSKHERHVGKGVNVDLDLEEGQCVFRVEIAGGAIGHKE